MSQKTRIGIIGCGTIGNVHATHYGKVENAELVAMCDILPDRLAEKAKQYGIEKTYVDYKEMLADPEIDAVSICVPNNMHAPIAIDALNAGKHVMLEKPMTLNQKLAQDIIDAKNKSGKLLQMGMVWRQMAEAQAVKEQIESGLLGEIYHIHVRLIRRRGIPGLGGWFTTKACSGGGGLIDIAVHFLDLVMWESNNWEPTKVSAKVYSKFGSPIADYNFVDMWAGPPKMDGTFDVDDYATGFVRFGKKCTLDFDVAWACNTIDESYVELLGTKGGVRIGANSGVTKFCTEVNGKVADIDIKYNNSVAGFEVELRKFVNAIQGKGEVPATAEQGLAVMKLLDAIYKSSELDQEVDV